MRDSSRQLPPLTRRVLDKQPTLPVATTMQNIDAQVRGMAFGYLPMNRIQKQLDCGDLIALTMAQEIEKTPLYMT